MRSFRRSSRTFVPRVGDVGAPRAIPRVDWHVRQRWAVLGLAGVAADRRADLDLQINLLSEYEITRMLRLVDAMAEKMGVEEAYDPSLDELETATEPAAVMLNLEDGGGTDR